MNRNFIRRAGASLLLLSSLAVLTLPAGADGLDINDTSGVDGTTVIDPSSDSALLPEGEEGQEGQDPGVEEPQESTVKEPWVIENASDWAVQNIQEAEMLNLLPTILNGSDMKDNITRREMCYLATTAYERITGNEPIPVRTDYFTDTDDSLICAAYEIGIIGGYTDGTFLPEKLLTRQEFFQILANFNRQMDKPANLTEDYLKSFSDRDAVDDWAESAAQEMVALGVVNGTAGKLRPLDFSSRQESIVMFLRNYKEANRYLKTEWLTAEQLAEMNKAAMEQATTSEAGQLVQTALSYVKKNTPYIFGATGPNAFDCSGFTSYLYRQIGHTINRTAQQQTKNGVEVKTRDENGKLTFEYLRPGDLLFFANTYSSSERITHVGIYMGNNQMVHAANSTRGVTVDSLTSGYYYNHFDSARRILD